MLPVAGTFPVTPLHWSWAIGRTWQDLQFSLLSRRGSRENRLYSGQKPLGTGLRKFLNRQLSKLKFWPWHNHQILLQPSSQRKSVENGELYPGAKGIEPTTNGQKLQKP